MDPGFPCWLWPKCKNQIEKAWFVIYIRPQNRLVRATYKLIQGITFGVGRAKHQFYIFVPFGVPQEAQDQLLELDRLSNELDAFVEKTKNATVEETEVRVIFQILLSSLYHLNASYLLLVTSLWLGCIDYVAQCNVLFIKYFPHIL